MSKLRMIVLGALVLAGTQVWASSNTVAIMYDRATSVNRHAMQFIATGARSYGIGTDFVAVPMDAQINTSDYRAVIVLNTGISSGLDPAVGSFLDGHKGASNVMVVSLYHRGNDLSVSNVPASSSPVGVDAVSAASLWGRGFGRNQSVARMHEQWLVDVLTFIRNS